MGGPRGAALPRTATARTHLVAPEEGGHLQGGPDVLQPVPVGGLGRERRRGFEHVGLGWVLSPIRVPACEGEGHAGSVSN